MATHTIGTYAIFVGILLLTDRRADAQLLSGDKDLPLTAECQLDCSRARQRPICGSDGRTYASLCDIHRKRCEGDAVEMAHKGKCEDSSRCFFERVHAQKMARQPKLGVFIPDCKTDGTYAEVQCHSATGYCWCVTPEGKPVPGTSVQYRKPVCGESSTQRRGIEKNDGEEEEEVEGAVAGDTGGVNLGREEYLDIDVSGELPAGRLRASDTTTPTHVTDGAAANKKRQKGCSQTERGTFNNNLIRAFADDYSRVPQHQLSARSFFALDQESIDTKKTVIGWKFIELDQNKNGELSRKEVRNLQKLVKKYVKPRPCARNFVKYCDLDQDNKIAKSEWSLCLGVDTTNETDVSSPAYSEGPKLREDDMNGPTLWNRQTSSKVSNKNPKSKKRKARKQKIKENASPTGDASAIANCQEERNNALDHQARDPEGGVFVPMCADDEDTALFQEAQCHASTGYCWCVDPNTGRPIPGTSTQHQTPDCEAVKLEKDDKNVGGRLDWKGCKNDKKKRKFVEELIGEIKKSMAEENNNSSTSLQRIEPNQIDRDSAIKWKFMKLDTNVNHILERKEWKIFKNEIRENRNLGKCGRNFLRYCDGSKDRRISYEELKGCTSERELRRRKNGKRRRGPNPFHKYLHSK
ncbi:PREDICTED: SPARC-related modular calcium-binding protein 1-like [Priapulus caudatus]|uniref:SPARC-related modular calcium-binding protein 1-like n=1 Tax=Priapulus caudatus TaxID=37621 RepID=A0ABM1E1Y4_PRICU|nr:PREDICTED: SPARC-related modular calcium-binding protein 1-like [Priapulus caudatus]